MLWAQHGTAMSNSWARDSRHKPLRRTAVRTMSRSRLSSSAANLKRLLWPRPIRFQNGWGMATNLRAMVDSMLPKSLKSPTFGTAQGFQDYLAWSVS